MPNIDDLRRNFLEEAHGSRYSIHSGATKMYLDLQEVYWWKVLKKDVVEIMAKCLSCQEIKAEHRRSGGLTQVCPYLEVGRH